MASVLGLSGGIGTGKSTVARFLAELGATVIDADSIVRELQAPGAPLLDEIADAFGAEIIDADGALDRAALADIIFRDPDARARLSGIIHPKVGAVMSERTDRAQAAGATLIVLDIPLLFEGRETQSNAASALPFDATVLVYAPENVQIERQMQRDDCDCEQALRRIRAQLPIEEKRALADVVLDNSGSIEEIERQARELYERFTAVGV
jgi:dephospho-CoA kinase